jgi:hypothetical protein
MVASPHDVILHVSVSYIVGLCHKLHQHVHSEREHLNTMNTYMHACEITMTVESTGSSTVGGIHFKVVYARKGMNTRHWSWIRIGIFYYHLFNQILEINISKNKF